MKKAVNWLGMLLLILPIFGVIFAGCEAGAPAAPDTLLLSEEVATCLKELNTKAMKEITMQIVDFDRQIAELEKKETGLREIKTRIDDAVAYFDKELAKKELDPKHTSFWYFDMPEDEMEYFQNESYQLVKFHLSWHTKGEAWEHYAEISIMDKATGATGTPEFLEDILHSRKSSLVLRKTNTLRTKEEANQILTGVLEHKDDWIVVEVSEKVYSVSGYGLGYWEELRAGEWYYYEASRTVEPMCEASIKLRDVITGKF